jgi:2-succinyl-5-enolpyruvyl-6-hydroxy-3-cyclohexene-1-carboxylate synthase
MATNAHDGLYAYVGAFTDALVRAGVGHLCLCPGSRSTPLALSAARHSGLRVWSLIDERSAAFFGLGLAKVLRAPVALLSTSGTAAANFLPAVIEARYGRVPLVVLTADRPHELRDRGANQTIDQIKLYGPHVKWFADVALPEASAAMLRYARGLAAQAVATAQEGAPGPVHLNFPFREPLVPARADSASAPEGDRTESAVAGRPSHTQVSHSLRAPDPGFVQTLVHDLTRVTRGLIVCGPHDDPLLPETVTAAAAALGFPVLADPLSQVRSGPHDRSQVIDAYDVMLRAESLAKALAPEVILRVGAVPASRPLLQYLERHDRARQIVVDGGGGWNDPMHRATEVVWADPRLLCERLAEALGPLRARPSDGAVRAWLELWQRLAARARGALRERLDEVAEPFEGKVFAELSALLPEGAVLIAGNSMPVRDLDTFFPGVPRAIRCLGNRGASGIDGLVSTSLGAAAAGAGPVVAVLGDLAFYHDQTGLLAARLHALRATIVLLNNDGGGIFSFMPQAEVPEHFEALFGTPHGLDFSHAARLYGAVHARPDDWGAFRAAVDGGLVGQGVTIVEVRTDRTRNVVLHREIWAAVEAALPQESLPVVR